MAQTKTDENRQEYTTEDLQALIGRLTTDQIRFVVARQEFSKDKEAAEEIRISPNTVKDWKYKGAPIDEAVKAMARDGIVVAKELRRRNLAKAMAVKVAGLDEEDARLRQSVASEIVEWELGKATQKNEVNSLVKNLDLSTLSDAQLQRLADGEDVLSVLTTQGGG